MKKVILCTVVSLLVFSGFLVGPWGADLAEALTADQMKLVNAPGVQAVVLISKGHKIQILEGDGITFREPRENPGDAAKPNKNKKPKDGGFGEDTPWNELPVSLKNEIPKGEFKMTTIKVYGKNTCTWWNGTEYCF